MRLALALGNETKTLTSFVAATVYRQISQRAFRGTNVDDA